ncbi:allophanate hydrolase subunit 1 [Micromonospora sp. WMMD1120]|uniref:5-oxoprolinase subunit B family protein n=1 Tax=Micromonospora sp. WMMD1120 TaxID=3016106 RepID=UPI0024159E33|nr:allophanate hydrolase subunit 1 [Micromonospora sp. WMMD1120]MDG4807035.1 allophanate hydrolase subunit 1 [Micromonospora sp. WMMD1120]
MRIRPVGEHALLIDCTTPSAVAEADPPGPDVSEADLVEAWRAELWHRREQGDLATVEIVPAASTVLLDGVPDPAATADLLSLWASTVSTAARGAATAISPADLALSAPTERGDRVITPTKSARSTDGGCSVPEWAADFAVPVVFDGPDLVSVADHWKVDVPAVLRRLTSTPFRVAFCGFAPGFPYLTGLPAELALPRLATPRPRVPAGSVALAGPYAGIYPSASPGGWLLVGRTELVLFDVHADPPARLGPGTSVRMVVA